VDIAGIAVGRSFQEIPEFSVEGKCFPERDGSPAFLLDSKIWNQSLIQTPQPTKLVALTPRSDFGIMA
jgi:hypothetical protein